MTSEEKASQKMDTSHVTLASNDDDLMLTKVFSNRNQLHCYHNNRGFCSFRDKCRYQHYKQVCPNRICREPECKNRHPVLCKYKEHCKFDKRSICAFKHVPLTNDDGDMKAMVVEIKNLKDEIAKLKMSVESKETKLAEYSNKELELSKLLSDTTGKVAEKQNLIKLVREIVVENQMLKEIIKSYNDAKLTKFAEDVLEDSSITYYCDKCDFDIDEEDALETHKELYHENMCDICDKNFDEEDLLTMHKKQHHSNKCDTCDFESASEKGLKIHKGSKHK